MLFSCPTGIVVVGGMWCDDPPALRELEDEQDEEDDDDGLGDTWKLGIGE